MSKDAKRGLHPHTTDLYLHAAIKEAAKLACTTPDTWVHTRIRACLSVELARELGISKASLTKVHHWVAGKSPLDLKALPSSEDICTRLATDHHVRERQQAVSAAEHRLFDPTALEQAMARITDKDHQTQFQALAKRGPTRPRTVPTLANEKRVRRLLSSAPHLADATQTVLNAIAVARRAKAPIRLAPLLLSGPPASGKTWWARQVADALELPSTVFVMPKVTASFVLSGSTPSWSAARPGRIADAFATSEAASPLIVLDELEKASTGNYDPAPTLLDLLDVDSATRWHDEFYGIDFDVSSAVVVGTCNDPDLLDPAFRSRFREVQVRAPGKECMPAIIQSAWAAHRRFYAGLRLPSGLPLPAIEYLATKTPDMRELQRRFDDAIARAVQRPGRIRLIPADFGAPSATLVRRDMS